MGLLDSITGGSESRSYIDPAQQRELKRIYGEAGRLYGEQPISDIYSPYIPAISEGLLRTVSGEYLPGGPGFEEQLSAISKAVQPQLASQFGTAGRFGSGLHQAAVAEELGKAGAGLISEERRRQLEAMRTAPGLLGDLYQLPYAPLQAYKGVIGAPTVLSESKQTGGLGDLIGISYAAG